MSAVPQKVSANQAPENDIPGNQISANQEDAVIRAKKRMLVVDDSHTVLHMICTLLDHHKLVEVVGKADNGLDAIEMARKLSPDLLLIDAELPEMSGLRTSLVVSQISPATRIILMTMDQKNQYLEASAGCGAYAVIYKPRFLQELTDLFAEDGESQANIA
jgi:two-component system nitrate/nitrite response regulator NarL